MIKKLLFLLLTNIFVMNVYSATIVDGSWAVLEDVAEELCYEGISEVVYDSEGNEISSSISCIQQYTILVSGNEYIGYGVDSNLGVPSNDYEYIKYELSFLDDKDESFLFYDLASYTIIANSNNNESSLVYEDRYLAAIYALRALTANMELSQGDSDLVSSYYNLAVKWNKENSDVVNSALSVAKSKGTSIILNSQFNTLEDGSYSLIEVTDADSGNSEEIMAFAEQLYIEGLESMGIEPQAQPTLASSGYTTSDNGSVATATVTYTAANFVDSNGNSMEYTLSAFNVTTSNNDVPITTTCKYNGVVIGCGEVSGKSFTNGDSVTVSTSVDYSKQTYCSPYYFNVNFIIDGVASSSGTIYNVETSTEETQRFFIYDDGSQSDSIYGAYSGIELKNCNECCETNMEIVASCETSSNSYYDNFSGSITVSSEGESTKECIEDSSDNAGNPYSYTCDESVEVDNPYCSLYCVEEYDKIYLSGLQQVNSGTYFKVNAKIVGTKSCYTSEIDYVAFSTDIRDAQTNLINAYNNYLFYEESLNNTKTYEGGNCCSGTYNNYCFGCTVTNDEPNYYTYTGITTESSDSITGEMSFKTTAKSAYYSVVSGSGSSCNAEEQVCESMNSNSLDVEDRKTEIELLMESAEQDLETAQQDYFDAISAIVDCGGVDLTGITVSGGLTFDNDDIGYNLLDTSDYDTWTMTFDSVPTIKFDYYEPYIELLDEDDRFLVPSGGTTGIGVSYCDSEDYTDCSTTADESMYDDRSFMYCTTEGCGYITFEGFPTEDLGGVEKSIDKTYTYTSSSSFYNQYPTGNISTSGGDQYVKFQGYPVSLERNYGIYYYSLTIDNLGEYYNDAGGGSCGEAGRLIDSDKTSDSVDDALAVDGFWGKYTCYYLVNFEEEECEGDGCVINVTPPTIIVPESLCPTCLVTGTLNLYFRTISVNGLESFNPNDRELGYNWNFYTDYEIISGKAKKTLDYFEDLSWEFYSEDPILTVTMNSTLADKINKELASDSNYTSYSDDTLTCSDYISSNGITYENIFCYSDYITKWLTSYSEYIVLGDGINRDSTSDYWTVYENTTSVNTDYSIGGPSWK